MTSSDTISAVGSFLFIGVKDSVLALDPLTGNEIWRTTVKSSSNFVAIALQRDRLFAAASGELYCLDPVNGDILWHNKLKGLGLGFMTFAGTGFIASAALQNEQATSAATIAAISAASSSD